MGDLISRQAALVAIGCEIVGVTQESRKLLDCCQFVIKQLPSVELKRKMGKWKNVALFTRECSECEAQFHELEYDNFCPNCGTDMRGEHE